MPRGHSVPSPGLRGVPFPLTGGDLLELPIRRGCVIYLLRRHYSGGSMSRAIHTFPSLYLILVTGLICLTGPRAFAESCDAPNPNFAISAPAGSVRPEAAAFSGVWAGTWLLRGVGAANRIFLCARIHVSVEDSHNAAVAYCYGSRSDVGTAPQCDRYRARLRGTHLRFVTSVGNNISLQLRRNGTARATMTQPAGPRQVVTDFHKL
jgi:hypothetical protein